MPAREYALLIKRQHSRASRIIVRHIYRAAGSCLDNYPAYMEGLQAIIISSHYITNIPIWLSFQPSIPSHFCQNAAAIKFGNCARRVHLSCGIALHIQTSFFIKKRLRHRFSSEIAGVHEGAASLAPAVTRCRAVGLLKD